MKTIITIILAIVITIGLLLFNIVCFFLQEEEYERRKDGKSKYDV